MQYSLISILGFAAAALAVPTEPSTSLCPVGLYSVPQCCATDVLGVADLNCGSRE